MEHEEEISLIDIWRTFVRHKLLFWTILIIVLIIGAIYTVTRTPQYKYTQVIKVAGYLGRTNFVPLVPVKSIITKANEWFMPAILERYNAKHIKKPVTKESLNFDLHDLGPGVIMLSSKGDINQGKLITSLFKELQQKIYSYTRPLLSANKQYLTNYLKTTKEQAQSQRGMNKMLLTSLQDKNGRVDNPLKSYEVIHQLAAIEGQQTIISLSAKISELEQELASLQETNFVSKVMKSQPLGLPRSITMLFFVLAAFIFAILGVFLKEFLVQNIKNE